MPTLSSSGTASPVLNTPLTVYNPTGALWYSGYINLTNMVSGDITTLTISVAWTGSTYLQYFSSTFSGAQTNPLVYFPPLPVGGSSGFGWKLVLNQTAGTARTYAWAVFQS